MEDVKTAFPSTFDIQTDTTLAIFWEKLQNYSFQ